MKNLKMQSFMLNAKELTKDEMKNTVGGVTPICFKCCPTDACSTRPHACPLFPCGPIRAF